MGLALAGELRKAKRGSAATLLLTLATNSLLLGGTAFGELVVGGWPRWGFIATLSFGSAAFLYLVTEELLVEAHSELSSPAAAGLFFAGFLFVLMLSIAQAGS